MSLTAATQMGMVIGTAAYMAPEQAKGKPVDKRADIWAFGVVLLEMLVGKRVFEGETASETLAAVMMKEPDWGRLPTDLPPKVDNLVRRCLEKDPRERVRDVGDVRLAMSGAFETTVTAAAETVTVTSQKVWQHPVSIAGAVLASLVVGGVGVWSLTRPVPLRVARFPVPLISDQNFSFTGRPVVAISPDGTQVVYAANRSLWLRPLDQLQAIQVAGTETEARGPFFSADGQSIGFWAAGQLKKVSVSGGAPVTLADVPTNPSGASWSADDMVLYGQPEGIMQVPGASGTPELLIPVGEDEIFSGPQMLPGGEWVLFTVRGAGQASWNEAEIVAQSMTTNERTVLISGGLDGRYVPSGHLIYGLNGVLFGVPFDVSSRQVTGGPVPLVEGVRQATGATAGVIQFSVARNGSLVYVPAGSAGSGGNVSSLVWVDRQGREEPLPGLEPGGYESFRLSPDGSRLALDFGRSRLWTYDIARGVRNPLTTESGVSDTNPVWTPDGTRIVFNRGSTLLLMAADGTGAPEELLTRETSRLIPESWSPDGTQLLFISVGGGRGGSDIELLSMDDERTVEAFIETDQVEGHPTISADGQWVAYHSDVSGRQEVYVQRFPTLGDRQQISTAGGRAPLWSPDGRELFYRSIDGRQVLGVPVTMGTTFTAGIPELLFEGAYLPPAGVVRPYDLTLDGERFLMAKIGAAGDVGRSPELTVVLNWFEELKERVPVP